MPTEVSLGGQVRHGISSSNLAYFSKGIDIDTSRGLACQHPSPRRPQRGSFDSSASKHDAMKTKNSRPLVGGSG